MPRLLYITAWQKSTKNYDKGVCSICGTANLQGYCYMLKKFLFLSSNIIASFALYHSLTQNYWRDNYICISVDNVIPFIMPMWGIVFLKRYIDVAKKLICHRYWNIVCWHRMIILKCQEKFKFRVLDENIKKCCN